MAAWPEPLTANAPACSGRCAQDERPASEARDPRSFRQGQRPKDRTPRGQGHAVMGLLAASCLLGPREGSPCRCPPCRQDAPCPRPRTSCASGRTLSSRCRPCGSSRPRRRSSRSTQPPCPPAPRRSSLVRHGLSRPRRRVPWPLPFRSLTPCRTALRPRHQARQHQAVKLCPRSRRGPLPRAPAADAGCRQCAAAASTALKNADIRPPAMAGRHKGDAAGLGGGQQ